MRIIIEEPYTHTDTDIPLVKRVESITKTKSLLERLFKFEVRQIIKK